MRIRTFRKKIYENHFDKEYLELEQKKKELEMRINSCLKANDVDSAKKLIEQLEEVVMKMSGK
jgi:ATP-binding cassette subfamily F protein 3